MPDYIEVHAELLKHPKMERLRRTLKTPAVHLQGHLVALWQWVMDYAPNGDLSRFEALDVASGAQWEGDEEEFVNALVSCGVGGGSGFLERPASGRLIVHDWHQYGGKIILTRFKDRFRKENSRYPTADEIRIAGLFPAEMKAFGESEIPTENAIPADSDVASDSFRWNPTDSNVEQRSVAEPRAEQNSVAESSSSGEESVRGEPNASSSSVPSVLPAAADMPNGIAAENALLPRQGENPQTYVLRVLKALPHWREALESRWKTAKSRGANAGNEWPWKRRVVSDWVNGAEPAPKEANNRPSAPRTAPKPTHGDKSATPTNSSAPQDENHPSPAIGLPPAMKQFQEGLVQKLAMQPKGRDMAKAAATTGNPVRTDADKAREEAAISAILADLEKDEARKADVVAMVAVLIPAELKANETLYQNALGNQLTRWARSEYRANPGQYSVPNISPSDDNCRQEETE